MNKKLLLLSLSILLLSSCGSKNKTSQGTFTSVSINDSYYTDLEELINADPQSYDEQGGEANFNFGCVGEKIDSKDVIDAQVVVLSITYSSKQFENLRIILIPYDFGIDKKDEMVPQVGYTGTTMNLGSQKDSSTNTYKGYNLSFKTKKEETYKVKVSFIYTENNHDYNYKFTFSDFVYKG